MSSGNSRVSMGWPISVPFRRYGMPFVANRRSRVVEGEQGECRRRVRHELAGMRLRVAALVERVSDPGPRLLLVGPQPRQSLRDPGVFLGDSGELEDV